MKILLLAGIILLFAHCPVVYADGYLAFGLGYHSEDRDCPEFCVRDYLLGRIRGGYEFESGLTFEVMHASGYRVTEKGKGFNAAFIEYKHNFKE